MGALSGCDKGGWSFRLGHRSDGYVWSGSEVVDRALVGDSALVSFDSNALPSVGGLECEQSLLSLRKCVLGTIRSTVAPAFSSPVGRIVEWERECGRGCVVRPAWVAGRGPSCSVLWTLGPTRGPCLWVSLEGGRITWGVCLKSLACYMTMQGGFTSSAATSTCTDVLVGQPATSNPSMVSHSSLRGWLFSTISFRPASSVLGATGVLCAGL